MKNMDFANSRVCRNCEAELAGKFCSACGQEDKPLNPSLGGLLRESFEQFFDFDGRVFRSLKALVISPGLLTEEYLAGRHTASVSPIRLYFVISVLYFALSALIDWLRLRSSPEAGLGKSDAEPLTVLQRLGFSSEAELQQAFAEASSWIQRAMFILIPILAVLVQRLERGSHYCYPQHLVFSLHVQAGWFCIFAVWNLLVYFLNGATAGNILFFTGQLCSLAYLVLALRRTYGDKARSALLKGIVIGGAYAMVSVALVSAIMVLPAVM